MSYYATHDLSFDVPASTVTRAQGGFKDGDTDVIGRFVERGTGNTVVLVADGNRPLGVLVRITGTKCAVAVGPVLRGKRGPDTALTNGSRVTGATRQESASGSAERGFIKNADDSTSALLADSIGYVIDGGAAGTANTPATFAEVVV